MIKKIYLPRIIVKFMNKLELPDDMVEALKVECVHAGTNLTKVCELAKVNRSTVEGWKIEEPKTIKILRRLKAAIADEAATNKKTAAV
jgi:hypothetical protein